MKILVTGCAGFIGMHVTQRLLKQGHDILGIDNLNTYYDPNLKLARLAELRKYSNFSFIKCDIADYGSLNANFQSFKPARVVHLAAQAGVRHSIENPQIYLQSNLLGFGNILEACRHHQIDHLVYASSSSVYGANSKQPYSTDDQTDQPVSLYAATKKSNELMAHSYSHLYQLPTTGLRYFTVYGPWGRPDMSPWLFTSAILEGRPIKVFNNGQMRRDFTYIDDIAEGTVKVLLHAPNQNQSGDEPAPPFKVYNIGSDSPVWLYEFISKIEQNIGKEAVKNYLPMQKGDVTATWADVDALRKDFDFEPRTSIDEGLRRWVEWYLPYCSSSCKPPNIT